MYHVVRIRIYVYDIERKKARRESFVFFFLFSYFLKCSSGARIIKNLFGPRISPRGAVPAKLLKHSSRVMFAARERSAAALHPDDYRSELIRVRRRPGFRTELPGPAGESQSTRRLSLGSPKPSRR